MGASADLYAERMRGPEPDEGDAYILRMAAVFRARHARQQQRIQRVLDALQITDEIEGEPSYVG